MNKTESIPFPADAEALAAAIAEKKDIVSVLEMISDHLKTHADDADRDERAECILEALNSAAAAPLRAAAEQNAADSPRYLILEGSDADLLWVADQLRFDVTLSRDCAFNALSISCSDLSLDLRRVEACEHAHARPILEGLEAHCAYLSRVIGSGLHVLSFPTVTLDGADYELRCVKRNGGVFCMLQVPAGEQADEAKADFLVYFSACFSLFKALEASKRPLADVADLIRRSFAPGARILDHEMLADYFYRGVLLGFCDGLPYADFTEAIDCKEEWRGAWRRFVADLIRGLQR